MGLIPGFEHDIFFSYAWDDERKTAGDGRWVREFVEALRDELHQSPLIRASLKETAREVDIYFDHSSLSKDQPLESELKRRIQASACLVILMSQTYLKNTNYCQKEREWFYECMQHGGTLNKFGPNYYPIFLVRIGPTENFDSYPPEIKGGGVGYNFFRDTDDDDDPRLCKWGIKTGSPETERQEFYPQLGKLTVGLAKKFKSALELASQLEATKVAATAAPLALAAMPEPAPRLPLRGNNGAAVAPAASMVLLSAPSNLDEHTRILCARLGAERVETTLVGTNDATSEADFKRLIASARAAVITLALPVNERETALARKLFDAARERNLPIFVGMHAKILETVPTLPDELYATYKQLIAATSPDPQWYDIPKVTQAVLKCLVEPDADRMNRGPIMPVTIYIDNEVENRAVAEELVDYFKIVVEPTLKTIQGGNKILLSTYLPPKSDLADPSFNEKRRERVRDAQGAFVIYSGISETTARLKAENILTETLGRQQFQVAVHDGPPPKGYGYNSSRVRVIMKADGDAYLAAIVKFVTEVAVVG
jgi:TIR domain